MATIYFVTETILKETTSIGANVDMNDIVINTKTLADVYIKDYLGTYFYNYLLNKYNTATMNADELTLLDYIQPTISWLVCSESVITTAYQIKNKGPQTQFGDNSANAEFKELMFLVHNYKDRGMVYLNSLSEYLHEYEDLYPEFTSNLNKDSRIKKTCGDPGTSGTGILFI